MQQLLFGTFMTICLISLFHIEVAASSPFGVMCFTLCKRTNVYTLWALACKPNLVMQRSSADSQAVIAVGLPGADLHSIGGWQSRGQNDVRCLWAHCSFGKDMLGAKMAHSFLIWILILNFSLYSPSSCFLSAFAASRFLLLISIHLRGTNVWMCPLQTPNRLETTSTDYQPNSRNWSFVKPGHEKSHFMQHIHLCPILQGFWTQNMCPQNICEFFWGVNSIPPTHNQLLWFLWTNFYRFGAEGVHVPQHGLGRVSREKSPGPRVSVSGR